MKKIAVFCIPAHGHTNPMLPVAEELVRRGDEVRFYSFEDFRKKIEQTGAVYVSCDSYLPKLQAAEERKLKNVCMRSLKASGRMWSMRIPSASGAS